MCGRFVLMTPGKSLAEHLALQQKPFNSFRRGCIYDPSNIQPLILARVASERKEVLQAKDYVNVVFREMPPFEGVTSRAASQISNLSQLARPEYAISNSPF